ncbi:MAG TPA: phospholipase D family protein [Xanthomonadales bacterium]|nr:phospholipase D family protein [Xanthomonadales bacterium]
MSLILTLALAGCASAIRDSDKSAESALQKRDDTALGRRIAPALAAHPGQTGMRLVSSNLDAFALRMLGARQAEVSLDLQYYIWHDDLTGKLLGGELVRAADRGVKVRLLVDDMDVRNRDGVLRTLDSHEHIEVRLFNPFKSASGMFEFLFRGAALNHRMHNKAFVADGQFALVGGRNVGDEYFGASGETNFSDMDLAMIGPAVDATSAAFDMYWNHPAAVRIGELKRGEPSAGGLDALRGAIDTHLSEAKDSPYIQRLKDSAELAAILDGSNQRIWSSEVDVWSDPPYKADNKAKDDPNTVLAKLAARFAAARTSLRILSPYFIPGKKGSEGLVAVAARGARVDVITNSLAATDVAAVHGGYSRYRKRLIKGGVSVYELKPRADTSQSAGGVFGSQGSKGSTGGSSAGVSLHTKAAIIDEEYVFIGSFNLDPRSAWLNCEMGVMVRSPELARELAAIADRNSDPANSFKVSVNDNGQLRWTHQEEGQMQTVSTSEPQAGTKRKIVAWIARILPLQKQL